MENEDLESELLFEDVEMEVENENETNSNNNNEEVGDNDSSASHNYTSYSLDTSTEIVLTDTQYNDILEHLQTLNNTNYLLCALLLTVFIYSFLRDLFERRKV